MENLKLFRVLVSQQWVAEKEALVLAEDSYEAERMASKEMDLSEGDAEPESKQAEARVEPWEVLHRLTESEASCLWFITPNRYGEGSIRDFREFMEELSPEKMEQIRIEGIERNNGQLPLW